MGGKRGRDREKKQSENTIWSPQIPKAQHQVRKNDAIVDPSDSEPQHYPREERRWGDLGLASKLPIIINGVLAVTTILYLVVSYGQLTETHKLAELAKIQTATQIDELHRAQRPWIGIEGVITADKPLVFDLNQSVASAFISYRAKNTGPSPAINVVSQSTTIVGRYASVIRRAQAESPCNKSLISALTRSVGLFIMPGEVRSNPTGEIHTVDSFPRNGRVSAILQLCTGYRDQFDEVHATATSWQYIADSGGMEFDPTGTVAGHWEFFGAGVMVY